ncbi:MAG: hypothetical protein Q9222_003051 [Ikaeria aurantiellina]
MASGIEIAGLALAVFPIVINGLTSGRREGLKILRSWRHYRYELIGFGHRIESARLFFRDSIEELLQGIVDPWKMEELLRADPNVLVECDAEFEQRLKSRLEHDYPSALESMDRILCALKAMKQQLNIDISVMKVDLALSKKSYEEECNKIEQANRDLRECIHQTRLLEPGRRQRRLSHHLHQLFTIRRSLKSLWIVLNNERRQFWQCGCGGHVASLRLATRHWDTEDCSSSSQKFHILFTNTLHSTSGGGPAAWNILEFEPFEYSERRRDNIAVQISSDSQSLDKHKSSRKSVRFHPQAFDHTTQPRVLHSSRIADLCQTIRNAADVGTTLGFLGGSHIGHHLYQHYVSLLKVHTEPLGSCVTLQEVFDISRERHTDSSLTWRASLHIAVTLASSILQLDGTQWLRSQWRSSDIMFVASKSSGSTDAQVDYNQPHISWTELPAAVYDSYDDPDRMIECHTLFSLGITLTELFCGDTIARLSIAEDHRSNDLLMLWATATRLEQDVYEERGQRSGDVVRRCLRCPFDMRSKDVENEEFQMAVFDHIVDPLQKELDVFTGYL